MIDLLPLSWLIERDGSQFIKLDRCISDEKPDTFAIRHCGDCLNKSGQWEYEPMPPHREDDFYERCRFASIEEAMQVWEAAK